MSGFPIQLDQVQLGAPAAERDISRGLESYFVESDTYKRVASGSKRIVIGNRGSGKSAIFQILATRERKSKQSSVIELAPEDYSYELLRETMLAEGDGSWHKQSAYSAAWKYLLYVMTMKAVAADADRTGKNTALGRISRYVRDNHQGGQQGKLSALVSYLKRLEGIKIGKYEAALKVRELEKLYRLEELTGLIPDLTRVLAKHRVIILVDELDKGWDASEDAQAFVGGLFQACLTLNAVSPNLCVYISLRQELYENIPALYEDAQKYRDLIETVRWDEAGLKQVIAQRLRYSANKLQSWAAQYPASTPVDAIWNSLFQETLNYRQTNSFNYVVDRTLYRPREVIQFCGQIVEYARAEGSVPPLDYGSIVRAERTYSSDRAQDIAAEYRFQYPHLLKVFEAFRGRVYTFERTELFDICVAIIVADRPTRVAMEMAWLDGLEPDSLIDILWRVGFLRARAVGGIKGQARSGSSYLGSHQASSLNLQDVTRFQVHPMFRSWLAMREPKGVKAS
jgi:hypothetical protein